MEKFKPLASIREKGTYFEGSDKKYPEIDLPKWMIKKEEE